MTATDATVPMGKQQGVGPRVKYRAPAPVSRESAPASASQGSTPRPSPLPQGWLTREQAAVRLNISLRTLDLWRAQAFGPPAAYLKQRWSRDPISGEREPGKPQGRSVCYWEDDVELFASWMKEKRPGCRVDLTLPLVTRRLGSGESHAVTNLPPEGGAA
jgi:hypothetical protein